MISPCLSHGDHWSRHYSRETCDAYDACACACVHFPRPRHCRDHGRVRGLYPYPDPCSCSSSSSSFLGLGLLHRPGPHPRSPAMTFWTFCGCDDGVRNLMRRPRTSDDPPINGCSRSTTSGDDYAWRRMSRYSTHQGRYPDFQRTGPKT